MKQMTSVFGKAFSVGIADLQRKRAAMRKCWPVAILLCVTACGGSDTPTSPPPAPVTKPVISTSNTMVYVGQTVQFSATGGTITWVGTRHLRHKSMARPGA